jgi:chromosome partitioning protein
MIIIGIASAKGGVGKTTTTLNLGAGLALNGFKVLMLDLDPQASLTTWCKIQTANIPTIIDILDEDVKINACIINVDTNLWLIPSDDTLNLAFSSLISMPSADHRLAIAMEDLNKEDYDFFLIDCPPGNNIINRNAFAVMDHLIMPIQINYLDLTSIIMNLRSLTKWKENLILKNNFSLLGLLPTRGDRRTKAKIEILAYLKEKYGSILLNTIIRENTRLAEAPSHGLNIFKYSKNSAGAADYMSLAAEVISETIGETK